MWRMRDADCTDEIHETAVENCTRVNLVQYTIQYWGGDRSNDM